MELQLAKGKKKVKVSDQTFGQEFNEGLIHQVVTAYMAGGRAGTKAQRTRAAVRGGGAKPWRQKGTGRARAGSIRSPLWRGGGKIFAAAPRDYAKKVNRKMYRSAMSSILSELVRQDRLVVVDELELNEPKTRELLGKLKELGLERTLIVTADADAKVFLAARNVPGIEVLDVTEMNPVSLVGAEKVLMTMPVVQKLEEWLG